jgi:hypothetical protein
MSGMRVTWPNRVFEPGDFLDFDGAFDKRFLADVSALVVPEEDGGLSVEIISILRKDAREIGALLKRDVERELARDMRTFYLNSARRGLEGEGAADIGDSVEVGA